MLEYENHLEKKSEKKEKSICYFNFLILILTFQMILVFMTNDERLSFKFDQKEKFYLNGT